MGAGGVIPPPKGYWPKVGTHAATHICWSCRCFVSIDCLLLIIFQKGQRAAIDRRYFREKLSDLNEAQ